MLLSDTIVALSTPSGESGIGIVRMSGKESFSISEKIFKEPKKRKIYELNDHSINYGWIIDQKDNEIIDEVYLTVLKAPKTYTRENMIEINCHGGWIPISKTLDLILELGARIANPGEFTLRAFLNGRIDLTQAEAVLEIIRAKNIESLKSATKRLRGSLSLKIENYINIINKIILYINAEIEFNETQKINKRDFIKKIKNLIKELSNLIKIHERNKYYLEDVKTVICGKPNVGKSTILNRLYGKDYVITSRIPGTTRDCIKAEIFIDGQYYNIIDTAGLKESKNEIERLSIERTKIELKNCDNIIMVFDLSQSLNKDDRNIIKFIKDLKKNVIWIGNKSDLKRKIEIEELKNLINSNNIIEISAKKGIGINKLITQIKTKNEFLYNDIYEEIIINKRQNSHLRIALKSLINAYKLILNNYKEEFLISILNDTIEEFDKILGKKNEIVLYEELFNKFCIGK